MLPAVGDESGVIAVDVGNVVPVGHTLSQPEVMQVEEPPQTEDLTQQASGVRMTILDSKFVSRGFLFFLSQNLLVLIFQRGVRGSRRSQRQIDREMKEEADRIQRENQAREAEEMSNSPRLMRPLYYFPSLHLSVF